VDVISTRQVAELLAVSEATVKRWADAGTIRCFRTPGRHRKFRMADVADFLREHRYDALSGTIDAPDGEPTPAAALRHATALGPRAATNAAAALESVPAGPSAAEAVTRFRDLCLAGDPDAVVSLLAEERLKGRTLVEIFDQVATPALHDIGDRWARGVLTVSQEHIASQTVIDAMARIRPLLERGPLNRGRAMLACPGDEQHDIAARMASLLLHGAGYKPLLLGARTPAGDLSLMVLGERPVAVVLSATSADPTALGRDVITIADACRSAGARLVLGGGGFDAVAHLPTGSERVRSFAELVRALQ
jgi:excisionase family DNA binding protein